MKSEGIMVLKVEPDKVPSVTMLNNDLDSLQKAVSRDVIDKGSLRLSRPLKALQSSVTK